MPTGIFDELNMPKDPFGNESTLEQAESYANDYNARMSAVNEEVTSGESFVAGFNQMSVVTDTLRAYNRYKYIQGYKDQLESQGTSFEALDTEESKRSWVSGMLDTNKDISFDVLRRIGLESETIAEANYRVKQYGVTMDQARIADANNSGYIGAGLAWLTEGVTMPAGVSVLRGAAKVSKLKSIERITNTRMFSAAASGAESYGYNELSNYAKEEDGGALESILFGTVIGGIFGGVNRVKDVDGSIKVAGEGTPAATRTQDELENDFGNAEAHTANMTSEITYGQYKNQLEADVSLARKDLGFRQEAVDQSKVELETAKVNLSNAEEELSSLKKAPSMSLSATPKASSASDETIEFFKDGVPNIEAINKKLFADDDVDYDQINAMQSRVDALKSDVSAKNDVYVRQQESLKTLKDDINAYEDDLVEVSSAKPDDLIDMSDTQFVSSVNKYTSMHSNTDDIVYANAAEKELFEAVKTSTLGTPSQIKRSAQIARDNGNIEMANNLENAMVQTPDGSIKKLKDMSNDEITKTEEAREIDRSFVDSKGQGMFSFMNTTSDLLRNVNVNNISRFAQDFLSVRGLKEKGKTNYKGAGTIKETFKNRYTTKTDKIFKEGFQRFLKEERNRTMNLADNIWVSFSTDFSDFSHMIGRHQHIVQSNPEAAKEFPASVQDASRKLSEALGDAKEEARFKGWDEGDLDIFVNSLAKDQAMSNMSRKIDKDKVRSMRSVFDKEGVDSFYEATEGAIIAAQPKWATDDAIARLTRLRDNAKTDKTKAKYDNLINKVKDIASEAEEINNSHAKAEFIIKSLDDLNVSRVTKVIGKTFIENAIRRSNIADNSFNANKAQSIDELLDDLESVDGSEVMKELSMGEREIISSFIETFRSRSGVSEVSSKENQFTGRIKMDPSYSVETSDRSGKTVNVNYMSMLSTDAFNVIGNQMSGLSSSYALASKGVNNTKMFDDKIAKLKDEANNISDSSEAKKVIRALEATQKYFKNESHYDADTVPMQITRIAKNFFQTKLGALLINIMVESGNATRVVGADTLNLPVLSVLKDTYYGTISKIGKGDSNLDTQIESLGAIPTRSINAIIRRDHIDVEPGTSYSGDWGVDTRSRFSKFLDSAETLSQKTSAGMLSTYRPFERRQRLSFAKLAIQGMVNQARKGSFDSMSEARKVRAADHGIDQDFFDGLNRAIDNGYIKLNERGTVIDINVDKIRVSDTAFFDRFTTSLNDEVTSNILHDTFEKAPLWTHGQLFAVFGQFRSFQILSFNHILRYDMSRLDAIASSTLIWNSLLGAMNYAIIESINGNEAPDPEEAFVQSFRRNSQTSVATMLIDTGMNLTGQDPIFAGASTTGIHNLGIDANSASTISMANSVYTVVKESMGLLTGDDDADSVKLIKAIQRAIVPNLPGVNYAIKELTEDSSGTY